MLQFISRRGLGDDARNLLSILDMGNTIEFWPRYHDVILNALAFTVFDLEGSQARNVLRARLLTPKGARRESANLALGNRYYEITICGDFIIDQESAVKMPLEDAVEPIHLVLDSEAMKPWAREDTYEAKRAYSSIRVLLGIGISILENDKSTQSV